MTSRRPLPEPVAPASCKPLMLMEALAGKALRQSAPATIRRTTLLLRVLWVTAPKWCGTAHNQGNIPLRKQYKSPRMSLQ